MANNLLDIGQIWTNVKKPFGVLEKNLLIARVTHVQDFK